MSDRLNALAKAAAATGQAFRNLETTCEQSADKVRDVLNAADRCAGRAVPESEDGNE